MASLQHQASQQLSGTTAEPSASHIARQWDDFFLNSSRRDSPEHVNKSFQNEHYVLQLDGDKAIDADFPLRGSKQEAEGTREHLFGVRLSHNSQQSGLFIVHGKAKRSSTNKPIDLAFDSPAVLRGATNQAVSCHMISPSQCRVFNVDLAKTEGEQQRMLAGWPKLCLTDISDRKYTDLILVELEVVFWAEQSPVCRFHSEFDDSPTATLHINALQNCRTLRLITSMQSHEGALDWYKTISRHCKRPSREGFDAFWGYQDQYARSIGDSSGGLAQAMYDGFMSQKTVPELPNYLYDSKTRKITDLDTFAHVSPPVPPTCDHVTSKYMIALLREWQHVSAYCDYVSSLTHLASVEAGHSNRLGEAVYSIGIKFSPGVDKNVAPAVRTDFTCALDFTTSSSIVSRAERRTCEVTGKIVEPIDSTEFDFIVESCVASWSDRNNLDLCEATNSDASAAAQIKARFSLSPGSSTLQRQMHSILRIGDRPTRPDGVDLSRFLVGSPQKGSWTISLANEFTRSLHHWDGQILTAEQRVKTMQLVNKLRDMADTPQQEFFDRCTQDCHEAFCQLIGTPGSGKTRTLVLVAISCVLYDQRIIITAQSNEALNRIFEEWLKVSKLIQALLTDCGLDIGCARVNACGAKTYMRFADNKPLPMKSARAELHSSQNTLPYLTHQAAMQCAHEPGDTCIHEYGRMLKSSNPPTQAQIMVLAEQAETEYLAKCHVILITVDTLSLLLCRGRIEADIVMVDDASQMTVPQLNLAVQSNPSMRQLFMFGDPSQHGSRPKSRSNSSEFGVALSKSPFEAFFLHSKSAAI
ncbi:hypothetical protein LTR86_007369 [Recurvomyces mirabilis]|nr:hypothetical protein LTR86_007369 [Recurvomyces mirabilis]